MKAIWIVCGLVIVLVGLCWVLNMLIDPAEGQAMDDLSREQQVKLMRECVQDAKAMPTSHFLLGEVARTFFEYRIR